MNMSLSSQTAGESRPWDRLPSRVRWLYRVRFCVAAVVLAGALVGSYYGWATELIPLSLISVGIVVYNVLIARALRSGKGETPGWRSTLFTGQILADVLALTLLVYYCGGVENPLVISYVLPVAAGGLLLPRRMN